MTEKRRIKDEGGEERTVIPSVLARNLAPDSSNKNSSNKIPRAYTRDDTLGSTAAGSSFPRRAVVVQVHLVGRLCGTGVMLGHGFEPIEQLNQVIAGDQDLVEVLELLIPV